jgi:NADH:ubiquinone oxidoreductase subunit 6 (subunit J)
MVWLKVVILILLLAAVVSLFSALSSMLKNDSAGGKTVRALAWRVGFSVLVFLLLLLSMVMGWVKPHGVIPNQPQTVQLQNNTGVKTQESPQ